jgi:chorismate mutase
MKSYSAHLFLFTCLISTASNAPAQTAVDQLQPLIQLSAERLAIADQVALSKMDSGAAVEDAARENVVITNAAKAGATLGQQPDAVSAFFRSQIEANKIVQYSLLANWRRTGTVPAHAPVDLAKTIRPELDQLQTKLLAAFADTASIRSSATCRVDVAKATGKYLEAHPHTDALHSIALNRSLATACER